jgi:hypothetical protein
LFLFIDLRPLALDDRLFLRGGGPLPENKETLSSKEVVFLYWKEKKFVFVF